MKKILTLALAVLLIGTMAAPVHAATPGYKVPEVPQISQIKLKFDLGPDFWEHWFNVHPIEAPKEIHFDTTAFFR